LRVDWHEDGRAQPLVGQYQAALDSVLESHPELRSCVAHCVHCGIRFLTHPRNACRADLRCPFGCREHHRRERSGRRSAAYYRTAAGKHKKQRLNARRQRGFAMGDGKPQPSDSIPSTDPCVEQVLEEAPAKLELAWPGMVLDECSVLKSRMLPYVRMVVSLIEGLEVSCHELVGLLRQVLRQHSIASRSRRDYVLSFLHQHPP
jgi:hypothetical protein